MALILIDFLHDGHTLAAIVERDAQTGEPVRAVLIVPPDPPRAVVDMIMDRGFAADRSAGRMNTDDRRPR
jgi:hypothetical protein